MSKGMKYVLEKESRVFSLAQNIAAKRQESTKGREEGRI